MFFLEAGNPFEPDGLSSCNIATGLTATKDVNVCQAKEVGKRILDSMTGKSKDERKTMLLP